MYTIDDQKPDLYEEDSYDSNWNNQKGLVFKIIIIILCIIVLVWLIMALKKSNNATDNGKVHIANVEKVRLAAEDYFFLKNNIDTDKIISLGTLRNEGLIKDVVDANNKVCSESNSSINLNKEIDVYKMTIQLACSTNDQDEVFYYHRNTLACLNCNGKTNMDGKTLVMNDDKTVPEVNPDPIIDNEPIIDDEPTIDEQFPYACNSWSEWTKERVDNPELSERTKTIVLGVKKGKTKKIYSDWSEYDTTPVSESKEIEVETKVVQEKKWSENKTARNIDTTNSNIKVVSAETMYENTGNSSKMICNNGYLLNNNCYSNDTIIGNLTYREYNSDNFIVKNGRCEGVKTLMNSDGLYVITYLNCQYNRKIGTPSVSYVGTTTSYTMYTYQELEKEDVTYYRYRTITTEKDDDEYTEKKYEEDDLPEGFIKVDGSEETYYSYRLTYCEK